MRRLVAFIFVLFSCQAVAQKAEIIKLDRLQKIIDAKSEKIKVINFWATWCAPCIKELPLLEKLNASDENVKVTLISVDMDLDPNPEKVYKFLSRKNIRSEVFILDENDPNFWIDKIEKEWNGSLPATIIINQKTGQRKFVGKELHEGDLEKFIAEIK